jgi:hypothetical protein
MSIRQKDRIIAGSAGTSSPRTPAVSSPAAFAPRIGAIGSLDHGFLIPDFADDPPDPDGRPIAELADG